MTKIVDIIKEHKKFLVTAHVNLEGDALGSELAMYLLLRKLNKQVDVVNNDPTPQAYSFLPRARVIKNDIKDTRYDAVMVLDCSDSFRTGRVKDFLGRARYIINIDHHISNTFFGDINWVDPTASSASEMMFKLCKEFRIMDSKIALCLYTGIFTDTGNFTYANTSKKVHKIVSELIKYNLSPHKVHENLYSFCKAQDVRLIGRIMTSLKTTSNNKIVWAVIRKWPKKEYDLTEVIFTTMRLIKGAEVFVLFKKAGKNKIRVNFRSRAKVDVNRVAKFFGGGGHKRASGTTVYDSLGSVEKKVIAFIKRYTNGNRKK
jgi:phosphoesterase RecJ-like protein